MTISKIVILTGAGISAESGLGTFRDAGGLWTQYPLEDVATPEGFRRNPDLVHAFYNARRAQAAQAQPNAAHSVLARLQREFPGDVVIVTQNVDSLHEAGGAREVIHIHGRLDSALCGACDHRWPAPAEMATADICPKCGAPATRPDVVWFGEVPYALEAVQEHLEQADIFAAIGTSGQVYPAAGFGYIAARAGAHTVEITLEPSGNTDDFAEIIPGLATQTVPKWVGSLLRAATDA